MQAHIVPRPLQRLRALARAIMAALDYPPPAEVLRPFKHTDKLLLGPGPSNCSQQVRQAASLQMNGIMLQELGSILDEIRSGLQYAFQTRNTCTYAICGTGMAGMEAAFVNIVEPGNLVLVLENGIWGARARDIAGRCGAQVSSLLHDPGIPFTTEEVEQSLKTHRPQLLFIAQGESSCGVLQPLEGWGALCHKYDCLLLVDTVASLGAAPFFMDRWEVDIAYTGSQKALGAPPGLAPISFSPRAKAKMASRKTKVQSYYLDASLQSAFWGIDGQKRVYHHTPAMSNMYALREALKIIAEEGLEAGWKRHRENAEMLWKGLNDLGLELFVKDPNYRLPTVNVIKIPAGVGNWSELNKFALEKHSIEIAGGLPPLAGKVWRIGIMGYNSTADNVKRALAMVQEGLTVVKSDAAL